MRIMFTRVVVLYIAYILQLPTWSKALIYIGLGINLMRFGYGLCKGLNKTDTVEYPFSKIPKN